MKHRNLVDVLDQEYENNEPKVVYFEEKGCYYYLGKLTVLITVITILGVIFTAISLYLAINDII
jgi:hypothetical protein